MTPTPFQRALYRLLALALLAHVFASGAVLNLLYPYLSPGGSLIGKIHPATYLIALGFCWTTARQGLQAMLRRNREQLWASQFAGVVLVIGLVNLAKFGAGGAAYLLDTLLAAALAVMLMAHLTPEQRAGLARLLLTALLVNALAAIGEFAVQTNIFPRAREGGIYFRASGFLGHPLNNGLITAPMLPLLLLAGWRDMRKAVYASIYIVAVLAFGARSALGIGLLSLAAALFLAGVRLTLRGRMPLRLLMAVPWGLAFALASLTVLMLGTSFGTRFIERGLMDENAAVRVNSFNLLSYLSDAQLWSGIDITHYQLLLEKYPDLTIIENFWVNLLVGFGIPVFCAFVASFLWFLHGLQRRQSVLTRLAVVAFVLIASTNNSLSTKSSALVLFAVAATGLRRESLPQPASQRANGAGGTERRPAYA
jgi:polysaccharide biosynthesis protein VpsF